MPVRLRYIRKFILIIGIIFSIAGSDFLTAQTALLTGQINKYTRVTSVGADWIIAQNVTDFAVGDTVMIMQMSGVVINADATHDGSAQDKVGTPGQYEFVIISGINTGTGLVTFTRNLLNAYHPDGKVQMVLVRTYDNAVVNSSLTCQAWDSTSVTGGVLVFFVRGLLTLNSEINVSGKGFRGGIVSSGTGYCFESNDTIRHYFYSIYSHVAGFKGEGVGFRNTVGTSVYPSLAKGRGVTFSGGGGGNGHYSGGGGGAGYGAGSTGHQEVDGACSIEYNGGLGGKALKGNIITNGGVYMGGGGGASTYNGTATASKGGDGGGIVIILAHAIEGNGQLITSAGEHPLNNIVASAGAGGGGGGGSVIISTGEFRSNPFLNAGGGYGGNTVNTQGSGGGGGGGLIMTYDPLAPAQYDITGGVIGTVNGSLPSPVTTGEVGQYLSGLNLPLNGFLFNTIFSQQSLSQTDSICEGEIPPEIPGSLPNGGSGTYTYQWQKSYNQSIWNDISGATGVTLTPVTAESATVWFRRVVDDGAGIVDISKSVQIIVHPHITNNTIGTDTTICYSQNPGLLYQTGTGPGGGTGIYLFSWEQSPDNSGWSAASGSATSSSYDPPVLYSSSYYHRIVNSGACTDISASVKVTVLPSIASNNIAADQVICQGSAFLNLTGSIPTGGASPSFTYLWKSSPDNISWSPAAGTNSAVNYDVQNDAPGEYYYKRIVYSGLNNTCQDTSASVHLISYPVISNNVISADQTICEASAPATINGTLPSGGSGSYIYGWSSSTDGVIFNPLSGVISQNLPGNPLLQTTWYRRQVTSSVCNNTSNEVKITVDPAITGYDIVLAAGGHDTICTGQIPVLIQGSPGGGLGSGTYSYVWASSTDNTNFTPLAVTTQTYQPGALTATTWLRRTVTSGSCTVSSTIKITVLPQITGNTVSSDQTICSTFTPALLTGTTPGGGDGTYRFRWESKAASSSVWSTASGTFTGATYQPPQLGETTEFRRSVYSGENDCCSAVSAPVTITVDLMPQNITAGADRTLLPYQFAAVLEGSFEGEGVSVWSVGNSEGDPEFEDVSERNSVVRKLGFGDNVLVFSVSNNTCVADPVEVILTVPNLTIPQGVTPNNDGINDYFNIEGLEFTRNELVIINTGGAVVYRSTDYRSDDPVNAWTGLNLSGEPVPEGTYYFLLTITGAVDLTVPDYVAHISGFIILRR